MCACLCLHVDVMKTVNTNVHCRQGKGIPFLPRPSLLLCPPPLDDDWYRVVPVKGMMIMMAMLTASHPHAMNKVCVACDIYPHISTLHPSRWLLLAFPLTPATWR